EDVPPVAGLLVLPQHLVDRADNTSELWVLIGIRMRPKYHVASTLKGSRDDVTGGPQRAVRGVVVVSAPSRSVEQGPTGGSACAVRGPDDPGDLRPPDDLEAIARYVDPMGDIAVDSCLSGNENLVEHPSDGVETGGLVTVSVQQLHVFQVAVSHEVRVPGGVVHIEDRAQGRDAVSIQIGHGTAMDDGHSVTDGDSLFEGLTVADQDEEGKTKPAQMGDPHRELVLRVLRRIPIDHERGLQRHHA